jgi:hypothetical protein
VKHCIGRIVAAEPVVDETVDPVNRRQNKLE